MSRRSEHDLDAALDALAHEMAEAAPRPGRGLGDAVMAEAALTVLAREAADAAPRPGPDLVARVLADAAAVAAERPVTAPARSRAPAASGPGLLERLFGWQAGAVAAMTLALGLGLGLGLELEPGTVPILDDGAATTISLASLETELMGVDGL